MALNSFESLHNMSPVNEASQEVALGYSCNWITQELASPVAFVLTLVVVLQQNPFPLKAFSSELYLNVFWQLFSQTIPSAHIPLQVSFPPFFIVHKKVFINSVEKTQNMPASNYKHLLFGLCIKTPTIFIHYYLVFTVH